MAEQADIVLESFRPGVMDKLGIGYTVIAAKTPGIVFCSISAYGQSGPWRDKPGVDGMVQAVSGLMSNIGDAGAPPAKVQAPAVDMTTGFLATTAVLAALRERERGGRGLRHDGAYGEYVRVSAAWVARIPEGMDAFEVVALGLAAYTSALAVEELIRRGVTPDKGPIAVTGATGGCSSFAIDILTGLGYQVVASTGKQEEAEYLKAIGAAQVIGRDSIATGPSPWKNSAGRGRSTQWAAHRSMRCCAR